MNNMPASLSKTAMMAVVLSMLTEPAMACAPSLGPTGVALVLGLLALIVLVPFALVMAGSISAVRTRRDGLSFSRSLVVSLAFVCEMGIARLAGLGSGIGVLAIGLGTLQVAFLGMAAVNGPTEAPLPGRVTVLSEQALRALRG